MHDGQTEMDRWTMDRWMTDRRLTDRWTTVKWRGSGPTDVLNTNHPALWIYNSYSARLYARLYARIYQRKPYILYYFFE